jgi:hypothetical protein
MWDSLGWGGIIVVSNYRLQTFADFIDKNDKMRITSAGYEDQKTSAENFPRSARIVRKYLFQLPLSLVPNKHSPEVFQLSYNFVPNKIHPRGDKTPDGKENYFQMRGKKHISRFRSHLGSIYNIIFPLRTTDYVINCSLRFNTWDQFILQYVELVYISM